MSGGRRVLRTMASPVFIGAWLFVLSVAWRRLRTRAGREEKEGARDDGEEETPELVKLVVEGETACHVCDVTQVSSGQQQALYVHM